MTFIDILYLALTLGVFALIALIAKGVEKLGPRSAGSTEREASTPEVAH